MLPFDPHPDDPSMLVACGDWACAHGDAEGLASTARALGRCVDEADRPALAEVASLAEADLLRASTLWLHVTHHLRARYFGTDPEDAAP